MKRIYPTFYMTKEEKPSWWNFASDQEIEEYEKSSYESFQKGQNFWKENEKLSSYLDSLFDWEKANDYYYYSSKKGWEYKLKEIGEPENFIKIKNLQKGLESWLKEKDSRDIGSLNLLIHDLFKWDGLKCLYRDGIKRTFYEVFGDQDFSDFDKEEVLEKMEAVSAFFWEEFKACEKWDNKLMRLIGILKKKREKGSLNSKEEKGIIKSFLAEN